MTGSSLARTMSQPDVAVRAMPDAVAAPPSRPPTDRPAGRAQQAGRGSGAHPSRPPHRRGSARRAGRRWATSSGRWVTATTVRRSASSASSRDELGAPRRRGARSARRGAAPARSTAWPGPGRAAARCPADSPKPSSPSGVASASGQARRRPRRGRPRAGRPRRLVVGRRLAELEAVAQRPGREERPLGDEVARPARDGAGGGRAQPGRELEQGRLADAGRAGHDGEARRRPVEVHGRRAPASRPAGRCRRRARSSTARPPAPRCSRGGERLGVELGEDAVEGLGAVGGGVELGADPADRPVGLGRQQDRDSAGRRAIDPWVSRRPTVTATMATEIVASSSSAADDRNAMRRVLHRGARGGAR